MSESEHEPDYHAEMKLPDERTCADCEHARRCFGFGFATPSQSSCDFWPSKFRLSTAIAKIGAG